uniref:Uncharacterized protein n=1 Tax=Ditylenchus dipsaci TaxID=166011 RepID=A0A915E8E2_9BILA
MCEWCEDSFRHLRRSGKSIIKVLDLIHLPAPKTDQWLRNAQKFNALYGFPHVIGALDGKPIARTRPDKSDSGLYTSLLSRSYLESAEAGIPAAEPLEGKKMKPVVFKWSNKDVLVWLNQLKIRTMKLKDVEAKILSEYGWKVSKPTMSHPLPKEEQKLIIITNGATHHKNCNKFTANEVIALDLNRKMREEVRTEVTSLLMATFEKYEKIALEMSKKKQENVTHPFSIAMKFPSYEEVRYQLGRARRAGVLNVEDPFELPNAYKE